MSRTEAGADLEPLAVEESPAATGETTPLAAPNPRLTAWWVYVLVACAVVATLALVIVGVEELRQTRYLREQHCERRVAAQVTARNAGRRPQDQQLVASEFSRSIAACYGVTPAR